MIKDLFTTVPGIGLFTAFVALAVVVAQLTYSIGVASTDASTQTSSPTPPPEPLSLTALAVAAVIGVVAIALSYFAFRYLVARADLETHRIRAELDGIVVAGGGAQSEDVRQYALLKEYHAQGLAQAKVSFWFSIALATVGFLVIIAAVSLSIQTADSPFAEGPAGLTLIAGTIVEAVSSLFFVQSNRARRLMAEFFDRLRVDRKLDEALALTECIENPQMKDGLRALLAMQFTESGLSPTVLPGFQPSESFAERLNGSGQQPSELAGHDIR